MKPTRSERAPSPRESTIDRKGPVFCPLVSIISLPTNSHTENEVGTERLDMLAHAESLGVDVDTCRSLMGSMCERSRADLEELRRALETGRTATVREAAHSIRGAASGLRLSVLEALAHGIEQNAEEETLREAAGHVAAVKREIQRIERSLGDGVP